MKRAGFRVVGRLHAFQGGVDLVEVMLVVIAPKPKRSGLSLMNVTAGHDRVASPGYERRAVNGSGARHVYVRRRSGVARDGVVGSLGRRTLRG